MVTACAGPPQTAKVLPCGHIFHAPCLGAWLQTSGQQKFTCPICRANLATASDDNGSGGVAERPFEAGQDQADGHVAPRMTRAVSQVPELHLEPTQLTWGVDPCAPNLCCQGKRRALGGT